jgi:hypothetical protein
VQLAPRHFEKIDSNWIRLFLVRPALERPAYCVQVHIHLGSNLPQTQAELQTLVI